MFYFLKVLFITLAISAQARALPPGYQSWTALQKQDYIWQEKIMPSVYRRLPPLKNPGFGALAGLFNPFFLIRSFTHASDEMPRGRTKLIHTYGSVAKIEFVPAENSPYTGIYRTGAMGLARLSVARNPRPPESFAPGMAIKFFIDGKPSKNLHVMQKLEGQGLNQNFFANSFSNHLPAPTETKTKLLAASFGLVKEGPGHLGIAHLAAIDARGQTSEAPLAPEIIVFAPTREAQTDAGQLADFRAKLARLQTGTVLYEVYGGTNGHLIPIGRLILRSLLLSSEWGDRQLFFQHNFGNE